MTITYDSSRSVRTLYVFVFGFSCWLVLWCLGFGVISMELSGGWRLLDGDFRFKFGVF